MAAAAGEFLGPRATVAAPDSGDGAATPTAWYGLGAWRVGEQGEGVVS